ncbi:MAG: 4'-phosphopantetheinyl transferase superfamily protein [Castellaniella sp.]|uniref:4'-phosphopantetheinyl transferase family protein n=1 Tax=Castellaniella sp. TaxID=1955812 RepID=UPI002A35B758|nr:4'-phosphopantetheinyl transferase superfamily protein [Castellaniella sp.]MDY0309092.1 4'-phosphopantetheinyl transferase superfamily protein [Castellaniella sp.]
MTAATAPTAARPYRLILSQGLPDETGARRLRQDLPQAEWRWISRLRRPDDRLRSLVGRALIRRLLGQRLGLASAAIPLTTGPHGKPRLAVTPGPHSAWHFNIAHSGDLVLVGIGPGPLGVDVEHCPDCVDAGLWQQITGQPPATQEASAPAPDPRTFCAQWVLREAVLKACGLGLSADPGSLRLTDADATGMMRVSGGPAIEGLQVCLLWSDPAHCAALCLPGTAPRPDAWSLEKWVVSDWIDGLV